MSHLIYSSAAGGDVIAASDDPDPAGGKHFLVWHQSQDIGRSGDTLGDVYMDGVLPGAMPRLFHVTFGFFCRQAARLLGTTADAPVPDYEAEHPCGHAGPVRVETMLGMSWQESCTCGHYRSPAQHRASLAVTLVSEHIALTAIARATAAQLDERAGEAS